MSMLTGRKPEPRIEPPAPTVQRVSSEPVALLAETMPCSACGIAVDAPGYNPKGKRNFTETEPPNLRCEDCSVIGERAEAWVRAHPEFSRPLGYVATDHATNTLLGLDVIGREVDDLASFVERVLPVAVGALHHRGPWEKAPQTSSPYRWAHVGVAQRAHLLRALTDALADRHAQRQGPHDLPPPHGTACLFCGRGSLRRSAADILRVGGPVRAAALIWREVSTNAVALGGGSTRKVSGYLCPTCEEAADSEGAIGPTARERALIAHIEATIGKEQGDELRSVLLEYSLPVPGWHALGTDNPNPTPWSHMKAPLGLS